MSQLQTLIINNVAQTLSLSLGAYVTGGGGGGSLDPIVPDPTGTYAVLAASVNEFGQVTAAANAANIASESTQQQILVTLDSLESTIAGFSTTGVTSYSWAIDN